MAAETFFVREATERDCDEIMRMLKVSLVSVRPIHSCVCVCVCVRDLCERVKLCVRVCVRERETERQRVREFKSPPSFEISF